MQADTLALLFKQSFPALFYSIGVGCLLCWTLKGSVPSPLLLAWLGLLAFGSLLRLTLFLLYFRLKPIGTEVLRWQWPYAATLMIAGGIWGVGALYLMAEGTETARFIILFFLVGMTAGGMVTYSAHRGMTILAMLMVMLPSIGWLYAQPGREATGMAISSTIFLFGVLRGTKVMAEAMHKQIQVGHQLREAHEAAQRLARADELTGLNNRRAFMELGERLVRQSDRSAAPVSCVLIDVDHFKQINDLHSHSAGDHVLQRISHLLMQEFRASDVCGRVGGEEFAVVLPDTSAAGAAMVAERFRSAVDRHRIEWQAQRVKVTVSVGVASRRISSLAELLHEADLAMYEAKAAGRNRVTCHATSHARSDTEDAVALTRQREALRAS